MFYRSISDKTFFQKAVLILLILYASKVSAQDSLSITATTKSIRNKELPIKSIEGRTGPTIIDKNPSPIFIVNNVVINDTIKIDKFRKKYIGAILKSKYLDSNTLKHKYNIIHPDGALLIKTKKKYIIYLE